MRLTLLAACLPVFACGGPPPVPAPVQPVAVRPLPGQANYGLTGHRHVVQRVEGREIRNHAVSSAAVTLTVEAGNAPLPFALVVDSASASGDAGIAAGTLAAAQGLRFTGRVGTGSGPADWTRPAGENRLIDEIEPSLRALLMQVPTAGVMPGTTWGDTTVLEGRAADLPVRIELAAVHEALDWVSDRGVRTLDVRTQATYAVSGEGERLGTWLTLEGTGTQHVRRLVDAAGLLRYGELLDTLELQIDAGGKGLRIPVRQVRADTIRRMVP